MRRLGQLIDPFRAADGPPPATLLAFMRWSLRGAGPWMLLAAGVSATFGLMEVFAAFALGAVVDSAIESDPATYFADNAGLLTALLLFFLFARPLFAGLTAMMNNLIVAPNLLPLVLQRLHRYTMGQAVTFFDNDFAGRIAQKQMQTASAVGNVITELINVVAFALATLLGATVLTTAIDVRVALLLCGWLALYFGVLRYFLIRVRKKSKARAAARAAVTGQVVDTITNIKTVKLFASDVHEDAAALDAMERFRQKGIDFGVISAQFRFSLMAVAGTLPVILIGSSLYFWQQGAVTAGEITTAGAISLRIGQMTSWVSFVLMALYSNIGEVEDGIATLTRRHTLTDRASAAAIPKATGALAFEGVSFQYGRDAGGLEGFDLAIAPGEKIALVGRSGAGKSTAIALLLRLYDPEAGRVTLDGQDLRDLTQDSLRRQIATVTQDTALFNRSARDNILYGRPDASEAEMVAAARQADAHDFILGLRDQQGREGYHAHLGERGVKLSGGQRQRIALARAILKDAPILVLDEATSALDSETEAVVQSALRDLMEGRMVIAVAHRLSTVAAMDRIIVLEDGRIVEEGTHEVLLDGRGRYAGFWARQSGGFLRAEAAE